MTFRARLRLFFATIVIVPMVGVALGVFIIIARSERGTADARIAEAMHVASSLHREARQRAQPELRRVAADGALTAALASGRRGAVRARVAELARTHGIASIGLFEPTGSPLARAGERRAVGAASARLRLPSGRPLGMLSVSVTPASSYARRVARLTGLQVALLGRRSLLASTLGGRSQPSTGAVRQRSPVFQLSGRHYRGRVATLPVGTGPAVRMVVFGEVRSLAPTTGRSRLLIAGILFGFSMLALSLSAFLVRENARLHERVSRQALTDERTGLPNLRALHGTLDREIEGSRRYGVPVSLVMLDIDGFANVNKELGHQQGDKVLASVGSVLRELSRDVDMPARYGGEEFAVVLPRTDAQGGVQLAERMRAAIERLRVKRLSGAGAVGVTASFGVASVTVGAHDDGTSTLRSLISAADDALLRAKRAGKNRVELHSSG